MDAGPSTGSGSPWGLVFFFICLVIGGAYFAGSETSLSTVNRIRMMSYADDGDRRAKRVLYILDHFDEALATILIGNNIMHIGSASLATLMATRLWGEGAVSVTSLVATLIVFFSAEMIPKACAQACSEKLALFVAPSLMFFMKITKPLVKVFTTANGWVKKLMGVKEEEEPIVSEDELHAIIENIGEENGVDEDTAELVQSALEFTDTNVGEVFTPWDKVETLQKGMTPAQIVEKLEHTTHSRLPVVDENGALIGMLQIRKYLKEYILKQGKVSLLKVMDKPVFVRTGKPIDEQLEIMSASRTHAAAVQDENGRVVGLLTVEDILEELVGEIYDEEDKGEAAV